MGVPAHTESRDQIVSFLLKRVDVGGLALLLKRDVVFFRVILGFHLPSLWISFQLVNWLKSGFFLTQCPQETPGTKPMSTRPQVRRNKTDLCSLIFTSSLDLCRGGRGGRSEWPHQETYSSKGATTFSPY